MIVNVFTAPYEDFGLADNFSIFDDFTTLGNVPEGDFMAEGNMRGSLDRMLSDLNRLIRVDFPQAYTDVVSSMHDHDDFLFGAALSHEMCSFCTTLIKTVEALGTIKKLASAPHFRKARSTAGCKSEKKVTGNVRKSSGVKPRVTK